MRTASETSLVETDDITGHHDVGIAAYATSVAAEIFAGVSEVALGGVVEDACHSGS